MSDFSHLGARIAPPDPSQFYWLYFNQFQVGAITHELWHRLSIETDIFKKTSETEILFTREFTNATSVERTQRLSTLSHTLQKEGIVKNWRDELYAIHSEDYESPTIFEIERGVAPLLGLKAFGVHVNGYVLKNDIHYLWIAKRSQSRVISPSKLDQIAAGGLPSGISIRENVYKECIEEANISLEIAEQAVFTGKIQYMTQDDFGIRNDTLYLFDLELPGAFVPHNNDGEVEGFSLYSPQQLIECLKSPEDSQGIKPNSALVMLDFLKRHHYI